MTDQLIKLTERVSINESDIKVIQRETEIRDRVSLKFEETLERLQEVVEALHRLLSIHDEKIETNSRDIERNRIEMAADIKDLEKRFSEEITKLSSKVEATESNILKKLDEFQKEWKVEKDKSTERYEEKKETLAEKLVNLKLKIESYKYFILGGVFVLGLMVGKTNLISWLLTIFRSSN